MIHRHELYTCGSSANDLNQSKIANSTSTKNEPVPLITYRVCNQIFKGQSKFTDSAAEAYFMKHMQKSKIANIKESQLTQDSDECHEVELQGIKLGILQNNREGKKWIQNSKSSIINLNTWKGSAVQKQNWSCGNNKVANNKVNESIVNAIIENLSQVISQDEEKIQNSRSKAKKEQQIEHLRRQLEEKDKQISQMKQIARQNKKKQDMLQYRLEIIQKIASIKYNSSDGKHQQAMESAALKQIAEGIIYNMRV